MKTIRILAGLMPVILAGCSYDITPATARIATEACAPPGGLLGANTTLRLNGGYGVQSRCRDGTKVLQGTNLKGPQP